MAKRNTESPEVCIVIINYKDKIVAKNCVDSLHRVTDYPNYKIVVVDNSPTPEYYDYLRHEFKKYKKDTSVIWQKENVSYSGCVNLGVRFGLKHYNPEIFGLLNNDIKFMEGDWLQHTVKAFKDDPEIGVVMLRLVYPSGRPNYAPYGRKVAYVSVKYPDITGSAMFVKRDVFDKIGFMDENFRLSFEDVDLYLRTKKAGFKMLYYGKTYLQHVLGYTLQPRAKQKDQKPDFEKPFFYTNLVNVTYLYKKHFTNPWTFQLWVLTAGTAILSRKDEHGNIKWKNLHLNDHALKRTKIVLKAIREGFSRTPYP